MRKILSVCLGLLLIAGVVSAGTPCGKGVESSKDPKPKKGEMAKIQILDDIHSCDSDTKVGNEVVALINVKVNVKQIYEVKCEGLNVKIEKWEMGVTTFDKGDCVPKFRVKSNYQHLITLCDVVNPKKGKMEIDTGYRLVNIADCCVVVPTLTLTKKCVLCEDINCPFCSDNLYCPNTDNTGCALCGCAHNWIGCGCGHGTCLHDPNCTCPHGGCQLTNSSNGGKFGNGWVDPNELGVGVDAAACCYKDYALEIRIENEFCDEAGQYDCGQVKVVFHPQI